MLYLTKDNIVDYVKSRITFFDSAGPISVSAIGEGNVEEDGDGFINFVFRVSDGTHKFIVKQSRADSISKAFNDLDVNRYRLEYETMQIRKAIVPDLIPNLYDIDLENRVFITEDVSHLKITRFQLLKGVTYPKLGNQIGRYMARTEFYTSVFYMDCQTFRDLSIRFTNTRMRSIMEKAMFLTSVDPEDTTGRPLDPDFERFSRAIAANPLVRVARKKLRHLFMSKGECLIHGDLHTSNIFADQEECKVIDMEYTFCGPLAYDFGYFIANFIAQYAAALFRPFDREEDRQTFKAFCLQTIYDTYSSFCHHFSSCFDQDAKQEYYNVPGLLDDLFLTILREGIGFAATSMFGRIVNVIAYPDYDSIEDLVARHNAKCYSIILNQHMLTHYEEYISMDDFLKDMVLLERIYCSNTQSYDPATDSYKGGIL